MCDWFKYLFTKYVDCMRNAHLLDEAYMELNMDEELGRGYW